MKSIDGVIAELKMRSSDDQVAIMRALADDNGYQVIAGYSITGKNPPTRDADDGRERYETDGEQ